MLKKILRIFLLLLFLLGVWYFGLKNYDYSINFNVSALPGEVYQKLLVYDYKILENPSVQERIPFKRLEQTATINDTGLNLSWRFEEKNDSISRIRVLVNQENRFISRLQMLTGRNDIQKKISREAKRLKLALELDSEQYKVEIVGIEKSPAATCACISLENDVNKKAGDMMQTIGKLAAFLKLNNLEMAGKPRIQVNSWDLRAHTITYEFCFPVENKNITMPVNDIYLKDFPSKKSIHAIYKGNYMYSHLAWIRIHNYAEKTGYEINNSPLEIFQENPELGGDSRFWRADIYVPLK
ncbi:hypothetical protein FK178_05965 [Antarcticibacterium arcticum]|uniref:AraC family transcriptional regulator n=1 Tax=Antarcticibacterium arcticum TaxID=2585771 RepID=A0A5B8YKB4_9FLAO|nr:hypothetical protein [Antarcticibacterium arcticum]QED37287.1 hypothetical protein FK178_05965 [Antarcticibacterium arcticum]